MKHILLTLLASLYLTVSFMSPVLAKDGTTIMGTVYTQDGNNVGKGIVVTVQCTDTKNNKQVVRTKYPKTNKQGVYSFQFGTDEKCDSGSPITVSAPINGTTYYNYGTAEETTTLDIYESGMPQVPEFSTVTGIITLLTTVTGFGVAKYRRHFS